MDAGAVWGVANPVTETNVPVLYRQINMVDANCNPTNTSTVTNPVNPTKPACLTSAGNQQLTSPAIETFVGDSWKPRLAVGIGFNWNSPFGPFRIDFAKVLLKQDGDDTKSFTFNVGTRF